MEVEYIGIAKGVIEVLWLKKLMTELSFHQKDCQKFNCDNKAAINISKNIVQHDRSKHIEVD